MPPAPLGEQGETLIAITIQVTTANDLLLDNGAEVEMTLGAPLELDAKQVAQSIPLSRVPAPGQLQIGHSLPRHSRQPWFTGNAGYGDSRNARHAGYNDSAGAGYAGHHNSGNSSHSGYGDPRNARHAGRSRLYLPGQAAGDFVRSGRHQSDNAEHSARGGTLKRRS